MNAIDDRYRLRHPRSAQLYAEAVLRLPSGVTHDTRYLLPYPFYVDHARGSRKWDVDGNEYIDYHQGHGALLLGHSHPDVLAAIRAQLDRSMLPGGCHELEVRWAQQVARLVPSAEKLRFQSTGTEASLMALRLARAHSGRPRVAKFQDHFHGWNDYMVKGGRGNTVGIPDPVLDTVAVLPPGDLAALDRKLAAHSDIGAVIMEPTGGYLGLFSLSPKFVRGVREVTRRRGVLLIFDEVVTGFRTAPGGAQQFLDVAPDLTVLGKILGGGFPAGAVAGRADILDRLAFGATPDPYIPGRVSHQGTYNGNPMAAAAGIATLELIAAGRENATADAMAQSLRDGLNDLLQRLRVPGCVHGLASQVHIKFGKTCDCDRRYCTMSAQDIKAGREPHFVQRWKCALANSGVDGAFGMNLFVSSAHTQRDVSDTIAAYEEALMAVRKEGLL